MMRVHRTPGPEFMSSPPSSLFATHFALTPTQPQYAVGRDGQRFLGLEQVEGQRSTLTFLVNWLSLNSGGTQGQEQ